MTTRVAARKNRGLSQRNRHRRRGSYNLELQLRYRQIAEDLLGAPPNRPFEPAQIIVGGESQHTFRCAARHS